MMTEKKKTTTPFAKAIQYNGEKYLVVSWAGNGGDDFDFYLTINSKDNGLWPVSLVLVPGPKAMPVETEIQEELPGL